MRERVISLHPSPNLVQLQGQAASLELQCLRDHPTAWKLVAESDATRDAGGLSTSRSRGEAPSAAADEPDGVATSQV